MLRLQRAQLRLGQIFAHKVAVNEDKEKMVGPAAAAFAAVEKVDRDLTHLDEAKWNPVHAADYREHIGVALEAGKKPEQAVAMYEQSIKLRSKLTGQDDKIKTLRQQVEKLAGMKN